MEYDHMFDVWAYACNSLHLYDRLPLLQLPGPIHQSISQIFINSQADGFQLGMYSYNLRLYVNLDV